MSHKESNNSIFEDVDSNEQTIRLVKDIKVDEDSNEIKEVDVLSDFKKETTNIKKPQSPESRHEDEENIPFEPTRELKIPRENKSKETDEYKERVIVNHSDDSVGVKKIIIGEETTTLPVYKKPKKDTKTIIRDILIYLMMVAIVSILVILLLNYCNNKKGDKETKLDLTIPSTTTTKITSAIPSTETTTTTTSAVVNTENTTTTTSKKPNLAIPTTPKPVKPTTPAPQKPTPTPTTKPTTEPTTEKPQPTPEESETPTEPDNTDEQG